VPLLRRFREGWVRPALFFGNNPIRLAGGAIATASGVTMIGYWLVQIVGRPNTNPYLGIICGPEKAEILRSWLSKVSPSEGPWQRPVSHLSLCPTRFQIAESSPRISRKNGVSRC
jgi:hypothetical protein